MPLEIEKKGTKKSPHLALCHNELQNGSANKRNVSLLMKSDVEITPELAELIEKVSGVKVDPNVEVFSQEDIEKASFNNVRNQLKEGLKKFSSPDSDGYVWVYVEDFDGEYVVFGNEQGLFYTTYSISTDGVVTVGNDFVPVHTVISYQAESGEFVLSENNLNSGVQSLIVKSFEEIKKEDKLVDVIKSIQEKGKQMEVEIQKAVSEATESLKVELEKANATIAELTKAAQEAKDKSRMEAISAVVSEVEKAEDLFKATASLDDESFQTILKTFKEKVEQVENSDLFTRVSEKTDVEKADQEPLHVRLLKEKHNVK